MEGDSVYADIAVVSTSDKNIVGQSKSSIKITAVAICVAILLAVATIVISVSYILDQKTEDQLLVETQSLKRNFNKASNQIIEAVSTNNEKIDNISREASLMLKMIQDQQQQIEKLQKKPIDCSDASVPVNGTVVKIFPFGATSPGFEVFCDGQWTVIQKRQDGSIDFFRTYSEYQRGFGDITGEYWLGLDKIRNFTATGQYELRVKLEDKQGNKSKARYSNFCIGPSSDNYRLSVGGYSGTAGDGLGPLHDGKQFTTKDVDNDLRGYGNCATTFKGAWWYKSCHRANLNGLYTGSDAVGITWWHWKKTYEPLKAASMMIKRKD